MSRFGRIGYESTLVCTTAPKRTCYTRAGELGVGVGANRNRCPIHQSHSVLWVDKLSCELPAHLFCHPHQVTMASVEAGVVQQTREHVKVVLAHESQPQSQPQLFVPTIHRLDDQGYGDHLAVVQSYNCGSGPRACNRERPHMVLVLVRPQTT